MLDTPKYINVILPLPVKGIFTYSTLDQNILVGQRVIVQFGMRKLYSGLVKEIHSKKPDDYEPKPIIAVLDEEPIVNKKQLKFWDWISDYYMCNLGDVMNAALPSSYKLASESKIIIHPEFDGDLDYLHEHEQNLINVLSNHEELKIHEVAKLINVKPIFSFINELIRKEIILIKEDLHDKYKEKKIRIVKLVVSEFSLKDSKLTIKQRSFIDAYLKLKELYPKKQYKIAELLKKTGFSRGILNTLVKNQIFVIEEQSISRLLSVSGKQIEDKKLADFQKKALLEIKNSFKKKNVCLLHGVTSSGKTELYIKLIEEELEKGKQVLYLLPEIALTAQIINRLRKHFGNKVGTTHSHLNNSERLEVWRAVQQKDSSNVQYPIILGARSSLFLPFDNLGLIIVDEEHDPSFKQHQRAPRYHARDAVVFLAKEHSAQVLLGSATPSMESYFNAKIDKYALVEMHSRYEDIALPRINTIDIRKAHLKKQMVRQFAPDMLLAIKENIEKGKQVILFQNRRGYSPVMTCSSCAYTPNCKQCDVSLTYHKWNNQLKCHYCGYTEDVPEVCPSCLAKEFKDKGFGTEQIEESLKDLFPEFVTKRMDYDTTRGKYSHQQIITDFEQGRIDILVGTQMLTKGLDFDNVALVGILNADSMFHFPDFRAYERAFQLMMQVAGRAGRKGKQGDVMIQTYDEEHELFALLKANDYLSFMRKQVEERKLFNYPPYTRLIGIALKHKNQRKLDDTALQLVIQMRKSFGDRVLGPEYPVISRIRSYYHKNVLLKIEQKGSISEAKNILQNIIDSMQKHSDFKSVRFIIDVDPV
ncbi:MAG: primosomal protein N' [Flavobacteriales bacterium]|nr:primosomal protein N' [Flavobacteriales bacterium]|tara:strand:- start:8430 stop:10874 length:2445 start_codon:yes stop_codon:yes gene_type:complete